MVGVGSVRGVLVAAGVVRALIPFLPDVQIARVLSVAIDGRILLFAFGTPWHLISNH